MNAVGKVCQKKSATPASRMPMVNCRGRAKINRKKIDIITSRDKISYNHKNY